MEGTALHDAHLQGGAYDGLEDVDASMTTLAGDADPRDPVGVGCIDALPLRDEVASGADPLLDADAAHATMKASLFFRPASFRLDPSLRSEMTKFLAGLATEDDLKEVQGSVSSLSILDEATDDDDEPLSMLLSAASKGKRSLDTAVDASRRAALGSADDLHSIASSLQHDDDDDDEDKAFSLYLRGKYAGKKNDADSMRLKETASIDSLVNLLGRASASSLAASRSLDSLACIDGGIATCERDTATSMINAAATDSNTQTNSKTRVGNIWISAARLDALKAEVDPELLSAIMFQVLSKSTTRSSGVTVGVPAAPAIMEKGRVKGGTLATLIIILTGQEMASAPDYLPDFLRTYRYFADASDVARLLILRYLEIRWCHDAASDGDLTSSTSTLNLSANSNQPMSAVEMDDFLQFRVLNVFKRWVEAHPLDFSTDAPLCDLVRLFLDRLARRDIKKSSYTQSILKKLEDIRVHPESASAQVAIKGDGAKRTRHKDKAKSVLRHSTVLDKTGIGAVAASSRKSAASLLTALGGKDRHPEKHRKPSQTKETGAEDHLGARLTAHLSLRRGGSKGPESVGSPPALSVSPFTTLLAAHNHHHASDPARPTTISDLDPTTVAQQLTLLEHSRFKGIAIEEFYCQSWNKTATSEGVGGRRLVQLIDWFNHIAYGVASEVVRATKLRERVGVLKRFIVIAGLCLRWNNYNTVFEIVAGLNLGAVTRLKKTLHELNDKFSGRHYRRSIGKRGIYSIGRCRTKVDKCLAAEANYNDLTGSYRVYRHAINKLMDMKSDVPLLPYLGVNMKDLTFAEDGNPTFLRPAEVLDNTKGRAGLDPADVDRYINFTKFRMISRLLESIVASQRGSYEFEEDARVQAWLKEGWMSLNNAELYEKSKACEPRQGSNP
ncbi:Ras protein-specific guanine nucleotide-releasing factor [Irineochytrium annulatum]|nr:Ras protein-specific guanine nucleotide-releasing factor [Irineochytrium annulatum]